ncbi:MvdC/MvdD family ATP grasp protein [Desulfosporosinus shakirovi]|uniref:MvdC/MvdD family ATP grasp protein n=1 Tax=Desulfosporosinus shakirovi TaxID=2885154 RepID=UPI001E4C206A|nr:hypothetical protein [Desulfosporosinus sp. SRJS8]MCB8818629.1 hypothetical protein [Desulfosporosinus sp. SRJS8]
MKQILVITSSYDLTVDYIIHKFKNLNFFRLNTDRLDEYQISFYNSEWVIRDNFKFITNKDIESIYFRKPVLPHLDQFNPKYHNYMHKEILTLIEGIMEQFEGNCLSKPSILKRADNKIVQLQLAQKIGFQMPLSLITNSNHSAEIFCSDKKTIVKPISVGKLQYGDKVGIIQTNYVDSTFGFDGLELAPSYFQIYIKKDYELRVTVVDDEFFPVRIETTEEVDWRKAKKDNIHYSKDSLPDNVKSLCLQIMRLLNLKYAAFDFIVSKGQYVFLELNANGQWAWLEQELNLKISDSIIRYLVG